MRVCGTSLLFAAVLIVAGDFRGAGHGARHGGSQRRQRRLQLGAGAARTALSNEVQLAVQPLPSRAAIPLARYEAASQSTSPRARRSAATGNGFRPAAARRRRRAAVRSIRSQPIPMQDTSDRARRRSDLRARGRPRPQPRRRGRSKPSTCAWRRACTGDSEVLRLSETGPNTGVFVGYIATATNAAPTDCALQVERNAELDATYVDPMDDTDAAAGRRARRSFRPRVRFPDRLRRSTARACASSTSRPALPPRCSATTA